MPAKLNSEFNYRYQIEGHTPWEKIKHLQNFLEGRKRAAALEQVAKLRYEAKAKEIEYLKETNAAPYLIMNCEAELLEAETFKVTETEAFELNKQEIEIIEKLLHETYAIAEPTRIEGFTDEQMFEVNAANEFTAMIGKEIYAEIVAQGHASPARLRNAMSNPYTMQALKDAGLLPDAMQYIEGGVNPLQIGLKCTVINSLPLENKNISLANNTLIAGKSSEQVINLFPIPLYSTQYMDDMTNEKKYIESLEYRENSYGQTWQSTNNFLLYEKELAKIKNFVEQELKKYCENVLAIKSQVRITQAWCNKAKKGISHKYHTHPNSFISGVFYFEVSENFSSIELYNVASKPFMPDATEANPYTSTIFKPTIKKGTLLLFPSDLPHSVLPHLEDTTRYSLAFNTFLTNDIGSKDELTYLNLKE